jgi:hypothetical protein
MNSTASLRAAMSIQARSIGNPDAAPAAPSIQAVRRPGAALDDPRATPCGEVAASAKAHRALRALPPRRRHGRPALKSPACAHGMAGRVGDAVLPCASAWEDGAIHVTVG